MTIEAARTDTAVPVGIEVTRYGAHVAGATVTVSAYDIVTDEWLDFADNLWRATPGTQTKTLTEKAGVGYKNTINTSNANVASTNIKIIYDVTAPFVEKAEDELLLGLSRTSDLTALSNLDAAVSTRSAHSASDVTTPIIAQGDSVWATANVAALATQASVDTIDANVDEILIDTADMQPKVATGESAWITATGFATAGDAMTLTAPALTAIEDEILDADNSLHLTAGTIGFNQDQAASGGAGVTPIQISDAVWGALQASYTALGTMGKAVSDGSQLPASLVSALNNYFQTVRRYGPVSVKQPLAVRDEVHVNDVGVILTVPVILDGNYSDLSDATSIDFEIQPPDSDTAIVKSGAGVTTATGSYTTWANDNEVFTLTGRWRVQVRVTWPDLTEKLSNKFPIFVNPPLPLI